MRRKGGLIPCFTSNTRSLVAPMTATGMNSVAFIMEIRTRATSSCFRPFSEGKDCIASKLRRCDVIIVSSTCRPQRYVSNKKSVLPSVMVISEASDAEYVRAAFIRLRLQDVEWIFRYYSFPTLPVVKVQVKSCQKRNQVTRRDSIKMMAVKKFCDCGLM